MKSLVLQTKMRPPFPTAVEDLHHLRESHCPSSSAFLRMKIISPAWQNPWAAKRNLKLTTCVDLRMSLKPRLRINSNKLTRSLDPELSLSNQLRRLPRTIAVTWQWSIRSNLFKNYLKRKILAQKITTTSSTPCTPELATPAKPSTEIDAL